MTVMAHGLRLPDALQRVRRLDEPGSDGARRSWIMLFPVGVYQHESYGKLDFSRARLAHIKTLYDRRVRHIDAALDADHRAKDDDSRATGWIERLEMRESSGATPAGLWGLIKWTPYGLNYLSNDEYRYFSPEFGPWTDPETGVEYSDVLMGGALTNRPFLKTMPAIALAEGGVSRKPWGAIDKTQLPAACFLIVGDPAKKSSWRLPVYEGAGALKNGMFSKRGPLNANGVLAAYAAVNGAHGQAMSGVAASVRAQLNRWHAALFPQTAKTTKTAKTAAEPLTPTAPAARAGRRIMAKTRTLAAGASERQDAAAELDALDRLMAGNAGNVALDELDDTEDSGEELDELDELDETSELDDPMSDEDSAAMDDGADAEDEADGGADDAEEMDAESDTHGAMTTSGRGHKHGKYGMHIHDGDGNHSDAPMAESKAASERRANRPAPRPATRAKRLAGESVALSQLREENERMRYQLYEAQVEKQLAAWADGTFALKDSAKSPVKRGKIVLTKAYRDGFRAYMLSDGLRLNERGRDRLTALLNLALNNGVVDLSARSAGSYDPQGRMVGGAARTRYSLAESDRLEREADRLAQAETGMTTQQLGETDPAKLMAIYERAQAALS